jgi:hypothetical protein
MISQPTVNVVISTHRRTESSSKSLKAIGSRLYRIRVAVKTNDVEVITRLK